VRNALPQHIGGTRCCSAASLRNVRRLSGLCDDPVGGLIAPFLEVVEMELHVRVSRVRRAYRIVRLAVFAQLVSVGVWLEACVLLCGSWRTAIGYLASSECEGLVCATSSCSEHQHCGDCRSKSAYWPFSRRRWNMLTL
jgi:hypothetical protein